jgi:O-antigen ligase
MTGIAELQAIDRWQFVRIADGLAILLAVSLPWSTTVAGVFAALYAIAVLPTLDAGSIRMVKAIPAMWLPIALVAIAVLGLLWADVPLAERFRALHAVAKLLVLVLALLHFQRSDRASWVIGAFIASCTVLLAVALVPAVVPPLRWMWARDRGVPVKDHITQGAEFLICAFALLYLAVASARANRRWSALGLLTLAVLFLVSITYVSTGRTALATLPVLLLLLGLRLFHWRGAAGAAVIGIVLGLFAWLSSPYLRERTMAVFGEVELYQTENAETSSGYRLEFWKKSLAFIAAAPVLGHGTGSIRSLFQDAAVGTTGASAAVTANPHNQTLMAGIQFGIVGIVLLWAMWIAHILLFRADNFTAWVGLVATVQNIVGSLFNSLLADFTTGWLYVLCVGAAGGAAMRAMQSQRREGNAR